MSMDNLRNRSNISMDENGISTTIDQVIKPNAIEHNSANILT